jgi:hypothetical protein
VSRVLGAILVALPVLIMYVALGISTKEWATVTTVFVIAIGGAAFTFACIWAGLTLLDRRS